MSLVRHVISLSTIPPRFDKLGPGLRSLLAQTSRPEAVELYIPRSYRRFPKWSGALPEVPEGVTIVRVDEDMGPATKVLPAARAKLGQDVEIIYVDDDRIFAKDWASTCLALRRAHRGVAICGAGFTIETRYGYRYPDAPLPRAVPAPRRRDNLWFQLKRALRSLLPMSRNGGVLKPYFHHFQAAGYVDIAEGYGGVMIRPEFLDDDAWQIPSVAWSVDDIWLSGMMAKKGIRIWAEPALYRVHEIMDVSRHYPLYAAVIEGADRIQANRASIEHMRETYGIWGGVATQST